MADLVRIVAVETFPVSVPLKPSMRITSSRGTHAVSPFVIVRVVDEDGVEGWGEVSCTPIWSGEDAYIAAHVIRTYLTPTLTSARHSGLAHLAERLQAAIPGHTFAKAGVEMALWDLRGHQLGLSVTELMGGPTRDAVRTKLSIAASEPESAAAMARFAVDRGYDAVKVKVGDPADIDRVRAIRDAVGPDIHVGVDANGGWSGKQALQRLPQLEDLGVAYVEQPVEARDIAGLIAVTAASNVPVVADESVEDAADVLSLSAVSAVDIVSLYVGMAGGIGSMVQAANLARTARLGWTIGSNLELGIGSAAHIHVAVSIPGLVDDVVPPDIAGPLYYEGDVVLEEVVTPGRIVLFPGPGLGVSIDRDALRRFALPDPS